MKTKLDFVTNSSSTNFCVYGIEVKFSNFLLMNNIHILVYVYYLCSPYREVGKFPQTDGSWKGSDFVSMNDLLDNTKGHNSVLINSTESMIRAIFGMESIVNTYGEIFIGMNPFKIGNELNTPKNEA